MTSARIRAIRWFFQETPQEFSETVGIPVTDICLMEGGHVEPKISDVELLLEAESVLELRGTTTQQLKEREIFYAI